MQNKALTRLMLSATVILGASGHLYAEQITVPVGQQAVEKQSIERPKNGVLKSQVEDRFGTPEQKSAAVGEPPISSWEYADYVVYFEYDRVLHSVLKRNKVEE